MTARTPMPSMIIHVAVSQTLDLLLLPNGTAQLIRGDRVFRLSDRERKNLRAALNLDQTSEKAGI